MNDKTEHCLMSATVSTHTVRTVMVAENSEFVFISFLASVSHKFINQSQSAAVLYKLPAVTDTKIFE